MKTFFILITTLFISTSVSSQEISSFERAVEDYFSRVNRIGQITFENSSNESCPIMASAVVSASSFSSPSRVMSYFCEACLEADDNGFYQINEMECELD
jgi:hypothetical protein